VLPAFAFLDRATNRCLSLSITISLQEGGSEGMSAQQLVGAVRHVFGRFGRPALILGFDFGRGGLGGPFPFVWGVFSSWLGGFLSRFLPRKATLIFSTDFCSRCLGLCPSPLPLGVRLLSRFQ
jgi:hypothetical protein